MKAQETLIDNTANNLANVNTDGFRRSRVDFADLMYNTIRQPGTAISNTQVSPTGLQIGNGVRVVGTTKQFMPGTFVDTKGPLDVAIEGEGFFEVQLPGGEPRYTRNGAFRMDGEGQLVNADGYRLTPQITVPQGFDQSNITIGIDGTGILSTLGLNSLFTGSKIETYALVQDIVASPELLAISLTGYPGDASNIASLANLRDFRLSALDDRTFVEELADFTADTGLRVQQVSNEKVQLTAYGERLNEDREASSGVSADEENLLMMEVERAFQAAARFITSVDETMEVIMGIIQ
jgi:flagellar basal body rod protein FlgG